MRKTFMAAAVLGVLIAPRGWADDIQVQLQTYSSPKDTISVASVYEGYLFDRTQVPAVFDKSSVEVLDLASLKVLGGVGVDRGELVLRARKETARIGGNLLILQKNVSATSEAIAFIAVRLTTQNRLLTPTEIASIVQAPSVNPASSAAIAPVAPPPPLSLRPSCEK